jgi:hypothetical protein
MTRVWREGVVGWIMSPQIHKFNIQYLGMGPELKVLAKVMELK